MGVSQFLLESYSCSCGMTSPVKERKRSKVKGCKKVFLKEETVLESRARAWLWLHMTLISKWAARIIVQVAHACSHCCYKYMDRHSCQGDHKHTATAAHPACRHTLTHTNSQNSHTPAFHLHIDWCCMTKRKKKRRETIQQKTVKYTFTRILSEQASTYSHHTHPQCGSAEVSKLSVLLKPAFHLSSHACSHP